LAAVIGGPGESSKPGAGRGEVIRSEMN
jgi:hypothetical protein